MKKVFNSLFVIIAAMVTFAGCAKQEIDAPATPETKTVQFFAESIETKTAFGDPTDGVYPTFWTENDSDIKLSLNYKNPKDVSVYPAEDYLSASFKADFNGDDAEAYTFYALSPSTAFNSFHETSKYLSANIPTVQTPIATSVDEKAQILYSISETFPTTMPGFVNLNFKHFTAYGKLSFINLALGDAQVTSVSITSSVNFAGRWNYMVETGEFKENSGSPEITLQTSNVENLWFGCAPVDMNDQELTFTVNTTKGPLSKTVTLKDKKFEAGKIATMKVNMSGLGFAESVVYELVDDPSDLTVDSEIIIVAAESNVALSTTQNKNNRGQASVTKSADKSTISDPGSAVQVITIEEGSVDGSVAFNVGNGYLYAASSTSNHLKTEQTLSDNSSWSVTIQDGIAIIKAQGNNTRNWLRYNNADANGQLFSCYSSGQSDVSIYKRQGTGSAPLPKLSAPVVTAELNDDETGVNVSWEKVENATLYVISGIGDDVETTETFYSFEDLSSGTYNVTVTAKADGYRSAKSSSVSVDVPFVGGAGVGASYTAEFYGQKITIGTPLAIGDVNWTITTEGGNAVNSGTTSQGKQFGTKSAPCTKLVFKGTGYIGGVQSVKINTSCASATGPKISSVTVGGVAMTAPANTSLKKGANAEFVFTSAAPMTGDIEITWTSSAKAGIYVKSIIINN